MRFGRLIGEVLLWLASLVGLACILLVVLAWTFNISLIMFRTGSMEPTIPSGSVAVVREVPAESVERGEILAARSRPFWPAARSSRHRGGAPGGPGSDGSLPPGAPRARDQLGGQLLL